MTPSNAEAKAVAADLIRSWCREKGTECFVENLLKLMDSSYLRSWGGLKHIPFPDTDDLGPSGEIPAQHWRFRFYSGVAAVLGWTERVTYGDPRYWDEELHEVIKRLWPDLPHRNAASERTEKRPLKRRNNEAVAETGSVVKPRRLTTVSKFTFSPTDEKPFSCTVERRLESQPQQFDTPEFGDAAHIDTPTVLVAAEECPVGTCTPSEVPPPSLRDVAKWKQNLRAHMGNRLHRPHVELKDVSEIPVLRPPNSAVDNPYVTRALFGAQHSVGGGLDAMSLSTTLAVWPKFGFGYYITKCVLKLFVAAVNLILGSSYALSTAVVTGL
ncbi:hypothetical protein R1sor_019192 [Riccia sorocarpa]|uniref:Uncharacterized protein n=1 Tax=Riccia sorocarpa TaxID=122646 RepID=A0ABD3IFF1_9MARC